ncbi:hypothetical protein PMAYCL1PPCAC_09810, partial [Pristionchus mayeri]
EYAELEKDENNPEEVFSHPSKRVHASRFQGRSMPMPLFLSDGGVFAEQTEDSDVGDGDVHQAKKRSMPLSKDQLEDTLSNEKTKTR